jgi:hypothetical protein
MKQLNKSVFILEISAKNGLFLDVDSELSSRNEVICTLVSICKRQKNKEKT